MSEIDMAKADAKDAKLTLKLVAKSGYSSTETHTVSANQWAQITAICADGDRRRVMSAAQDLLDALTTLRQWVKAWDVGFLFDDEWPADEAKIDAAIAKATHQ